MSSSRRWVSVRLSKNPIRKWNIRLFIQFFRRARKKNTEIIRKNNCFLWRRWQRRTRNKNKRRKKYLKINKQTIPCGARMRTRAKKSGRTPGRAILNQLKCPETVENENLFYSKPRPTWHLNSALGSEFNGGFWRAFVIRWIPGSQAYLEIESSSGLFLIIFVILWGAKWYTEDNALRWVQPQWLRMW